LRDHLAGCTRYTAAGSLLVQPAPQANLRSHVYRLFAGSIRKGGKGSIAPVREPFEE
jgi:hypothetical protein